MMRLYNLVKEYATQIQAVHRKKNGKIIQLNQTNSEIEVFC